MSKLNRRRAGPDYLLATAQENKEKTGAFEEVSSQWMSEDGINFFPAPRTVSVLAPGYYDTLIGMSGPFFKKLELKTDSLLRLPDSETDRVLKEIASFWEKRESFLKHGLTHKRGILLWGPAGSGKSTTIQMVIQEVIKLGGVALKFDNADGFSHCFRAFREVQPNTPVVVVMEDVDVILQRNSSSEVLNILDGVEGTDRLVFIASTNYPELLEDRVSNRPSRFDKRIKIDFPSEEARAAYISFLFKGGKPENMGAWLHDTKGMSVAHIKELFIGTQILNNAYEETLYTLNKMKEKIEGGKRPGSRRAGLMEEER